MGNMCACCGTNYVSNPGDICLTCQLSGRAPSADSGSRRPKSGAGDNTPNYPDGLTGMDFQSMDGSGKGARIRTEKTSGSVTVCGTVQGFRQEIDNQKPFSKIIRSIVKGTAFSPSKERYIFEVAEDTSHSYDFTGRKSYCVIIEGELSYGSLNNNDVVQVTGFKGGNGIISASRIYNQSNCTTIDVRGQVSPVALRILAAIILLAVIGGIISAIVFSGNGGAGSVSATGGSAASSLSQWGKRVMPVLVGIGLILFGLKFGNQMGQRTKMYLIGAGAVALLCVFYPAALTYIALILIMLYGIKYMFKALR